MKKKCPIVKEECWEHKCEFYSHLMGRNPQTGLDEDKYGCAISWLPILLIENASVTRQAAASTDKVATEVRSQHATFIGALSEDAKQRLGYVNPRVNKEHNGNSNGLQTLPDEPR